MNKMQIAQKITEELIELDKRLHGAEITPLEWQEKKRELYRRYNPDVNVWRKACKDYELRTFDQYIPMRDC